MAAPAAKAEQWFTIPEVAELLNVSRATVYRLISSGRLETNDAGLGKKRTKSRVSESAIAKYQTSTAQKPLAHGRAA